MSGRRSALIVANDRYDDARLRRLRAPATDAEELGAVLRDPEIGAFDVEVSLNEPEHVVRRRLSAFFDDRGPEDLLLLHLSCHGVKDEDGRLYFATPDTEMAHLEATSIPSEFVNRQMTRSRSKRVLLLLDCCYSGAFARGLMSRAGDRVDIMERFDGRGRIVLTASSSMEYSFEGDQLSGKGRPSVFTSAIVDGLATGAADRNGDGVVSVDELYDYAFDQVRAATPSQTPGKWVFDVQGDFHVAKSVAPPPEPEPEPVRPILMAAAQPPPPPAAPPDPPMPPFLPRGSRIAAVALLAALPIPALAPDLEPWNTFALLSPVLVAAALLALWLLGGAAERLGTRFAGGVLLAVGAVTTAGALGLVKFSAERIDAIAVLLAVVATVGGALALYLGLTTPRGGELTGGRTDPAALVFGLAGGALVLAGIFLPYDGDSSIWSEIGEWESAEFALVPLVALVLLLLALATLGPWPRWAGPLLLTTGALTTLHFAGVVVAAALAIGEAGEVRAGGPTGLVGGTLIALAGTIALRQPPTPTPTQPPIE